MAVKQTAGRTTLKEFAPKFAELNDDVLFGQVWSREDKLSLKERSLITVVALLSQGLIDTSFIHHLESAKANGITKSEIAEIITHAAFYAGWPKAWLLSAWQKIFGKKTQMKRTKKPLMKNLCCFQSDSQTIPLHSILWDKVILPLFQKNRWAFSM